MIAAAQTTSPDAVEEAHVVNGRLLATVVAFAEMKLGKEAAQVMFESALAGSGFTPAQAIDPRGWVPLSVLERAGDVFEPKLGPTCVTDAFTWAVPIRVDWSAMSLSALANPDFMMRRLDRAREFFARHLRFDVEMQGRGRARVRIVYSEGQPRKKHSCRVGQGVIHGVPMIFNMPPAEVRETACYADGHAACVYEVRWRAEPASVWLGFWLGLAAAIMGALVVPSAAWAATPVLGWLLGRELRSYRLQRYMTKVSEEHRRALAENERDFARRYDELKELNDRLEQRVAERTKHLDAMLTALRDANAELRRTIDEMSAIHADVVDAGVRNMLGRVEEFAHEINNPMTIVLANTQLLEDTDSLRADVGELGAVARDIREAVNRMRAVVGWFIELYKADGELLDCPLHEHVQQVADAMGRQWRGRVNVTTELQPITIAAWGMQLMQVVENLLINAAQAHGTRNITVRTFRKSGFAKVVVSDDGPGIALESQQRIFERGFTTKPGHGSGLGLYISRAIVERHGGTLLLRSEPGRGADFELTLPLHEG